MTRTLGGVRGELRQLLAEPSTRLSYTGEFNIVIDCNNAGVLAEFYSRLLGWEWTRPRANGWAAVASPTGMVFAFPEVEEYSL